MSVSANSATGIAFAPPLLATGMPISPAIAKSTPSYPAEHSCTSLVFFAARSMLSSTPCPNAIIKSASVAALISSC